MRTFHIFILAYALAMLGCGYKTTPFWSDDTQKSEEVKQSTKESQSTEKKQ